MSSSSVGKRENKAAYLIGPKVRPLKVDAAPYTSPKAGEITVRNHAIAINPIDRMKQVLGDFLYGHLKYPIILGTDLAGEVVEVGKAVSRFEIGDRVLAFANGMDKPRNSSAETSFQQYTVVTENLATKIPNSLSMEKAAVIPLGVATAACGLYEKDQLAAPYPSMKPEPNDKVLIIWGGSTSVGCNAIQLAVASGFEVFTTCSPRNFDLCKRLGASQAFDYKSNNVVRDMIAALKGKVLSGAMTIGDGGAETCSDIMIKVKCDKKFISMVSYPLPKPLPESLVVPKLAFSFVSWNLVWYVKCQLRGIKSKFVFGSSLAYNDISKEIFGEYLPQALAQEKFIAAPEPHVLGHGLEKIQDAFDAQKEVSAKKIVVTL